jgi:nucleoid-associated protein YgaU
MRRPFPIAAAVLTIGVLGSPLAHAQAPDPQNALHLDIPDPDTDPSPAADDAAGIDPADAPAAGEAPDPTDTEDPYDTPVPPSTVAARPGPTVTATPEVTPIATVPDQPEAPSPTPAPSTTAPPPVSSATPVVSSPPAVAAPTQAPTTPAPTAPSQTASQPSSEDRHRHAPPPHITGAHAHPVRTAAPRTVLRVRFRRATPAPASPPTGEYVVRAGDTLSAIAMRHGTNWQALWALNRDRIADPDLIYPGQVLRA